MPLPDSLAPLRYLTEVDRFVNLTKLFGPESGTGPIDGSSTNSPHIFFVDSVNGSVNNSGRLPSAALTTVTLALAQCTAGRGDFIILLPGHAETISAASGITCSKSGVSIIGMGTGALRPTFTWSATASTWLISGANVLIQNILCTSTIAGVVKAFSITGAHCTLDAVDYIEDGTTDLLQFALTTLAADHLTIKNCSWIAGTTARASVSVWIGLVGADYCKILDNYLIHKGTANNADAFITGSATASIGVQIERNRGYFSPSNACVPITMLSASTGVIANNYFGVSKTGIAGSIAPASCFCFENYVSNEVAKSGMAEPAIDTA